MSVATLVGMLPAYPINSWMVARDLKHGMMSAIPKPGGGANMNMQATMDGPMDMQATMDGPMDMQGDMSHSRHGSKPSKLLLASVLFGTFGILFLVLLLTNFFAPIKFALGG